MNFFHPLASLFSLQPPPAQHISQVPKEYNPELLDKQFLLAISKSDMLDDELKEAIAAELPEDVPHVFISSVTQQGLSQLKDMLWNALNATPKA